MVTMCSCGSCEQEKVSVSESVDDYEVLLVLKSER